MLHMRVHKGHDTYMRHWLLKG